jgi:hypothetical protein
MRVIPGYGSASVRAVTGNYNELSMLIQEKGNQVSNNSLNQR